MNLLQIGQISAWKETDDYEKLNVQGNAVFARSNNGQNAVIRTTEANRIIDESTLTEYVEPLGILKSFSVSDTGLVLACFYNSIGNFSITRIMNISNLSTILDNDVWSGLGTATSVTPSGDKSAIGFPKENTVRTYLLLPDGKFDRSSFVILKENNNYPPGRFGEKVALSESGMSLAVASPGAMRDSIDVGAVFVFVWIDKKWQNTESVFYGTDDLRRIGAGGIAIDDHIGLINVRENNGRHRAFKVGTAFLCCYLKSNYFRLVDLTLHFDFFQV